MPGIGPATKDRLSDFGINKIGQVVGHLLTFDNGVRDTTEVCQALYDFLKNEVGVTANKHTIVFAAHNVADEKGLNIGA